MCNRVTIVIKYNKFYNAILFFSFHLYFSLFLMDSTERWSKRPHSTITQRNVDKELQRIKSLAVVSVLNKNFNKEPTAPLRSSSLLPTLSPSSSLTTENENLESSSSKNRSRSMSVYSLSNDTSTTTIKRKSNNNLYTEYNQHTTPNSVPATASQGIFDGEQIALAEKESNLDSLVINSQQNLEKENLIKRVQELQALYDASQMDLQTAEDRNITQSNLVALQDKLISNMSDQLDYFTAETTEESDSSSAICSIDPETEEGKRSLEAVQQELASVCKELSDMKSLKTQYESLISDMLIRVSLYEDKMDEMESIAKSIQKEHSNQIQFIDTKVQTLVEKLLETNETINRLQVEHYQEKQTLLAKQQELLHSNSSIKSINDSSSVIWEIGEEKEDVAEPGSTRLSYMSTSSRSDNPQRKSFIARWKGSAMPPASPPPSVPLPPIPTGTSRSSSRPKSTLSEIYASSSTSTVPQNYKHVSVDAVGGIGRRTSSVSSELDSEITDAMYYKEFTDQLKERLSVSKEIDDLTVWTPSDYDIIQKKIESNRWSSGSDDGTQRDQTAFWKGMKKKLRV